MKKFVFRRFLPLIFGCLIFSITALADGVTFGPASITQSCDTCPTNATLTPPPGVPATQATVSFDNFSLTPTGQGSGSIGILLQFMSSAAPLNSVTFHIEGMFPADAMISITERVLDDMNMVLAQTTTMSTADFTLNFAPTANGFFDIFIELSVGLDPISVTSIQQTVTQVPEPMTLTLLGLGLAGLGVVRKKRSRS